jgi:DNA-binding NtrC family response regulator
MDLDSLYLIGHTTVLVCADGLRISIGMTELLQNLSLEAKWARGVAGASDLPTREDTSTCFCGILLADGRYRELVEHENRGTTEIPVIMVSRPSCPNEDRDNHAAMNIGEFDLQCHP